MGLPTGKLREGYVRVAGVATVEALMALRVLQEEQGLPTLSKAVGAALEEWRKARERGVLSRDRGADEQPEAAAQTRGSTPPEKGGD